MRLAPVYWSLVPVRVFCLYLLPICLWFEFGLAQDSSGTSSITGIELTLLTLGSNRFRLQCEAKGKNIVDNLMILHCPLTKTKVCMQNCLDPCKRDLSCSQDHISPVQDCKYTSLSSDHVKVEYDLQLEVTHRTGQWWCIARGQESNRIMLEYKEPRVRPEARREQEEGKAVSTVAEEMEEKKTSTELSGLSIPITETIFFRGFSREIFIILIVITSLSVFLNLYLYIRCIVVKSYFNQIYMGYPSRQWIDNLCCVDRRKPRFRGDPIQPNLPHGGSGWKPGAHIGHSLPHLSSTVLVRDVRMPLTAPTTPLVAYRQQLVAHEGPPMVQSSVPMQSNPSLTELIYDEVPESVHKGSEYGPQSLQQLMKTPDGQSWILDHRGRVYLPYGLVKQSGSIELPATNVDESLATQSTAVWGNVYTPLQPSAGCQPTYAEFGRDPVIPQPSPRKRPLVSFGQPVSSDVANANSRLSTESESVEPRSPGNQWTKQTLATLSEETSNLSLGKSYDLTPAQIATISEMNFGGDQTSFP